MKKKRTEKNEKLAQNEVFGSVEAVKTVSDLNMPVAGEVLAVNELINNQPELLWKILKK